jgi:hypothetical protein
MSWLVVFISSFVPIVFLFILLITEWLHGEPRSKLSFFTQALGRDERKGQMDWVRWFDALRRDSVTGQPDFVIRWTNRCSLKLNRRKTP